MNLKRMWREFKQHLLKNISFILLIALSVMIIVGFNRAMDSYIEGANKLHRDANVEDGQFSVYGSLPKKQKLSTQRRFNVVIEENKSIDYELSPTQTLRIISADREINKLTIITGGSLENTTDVVLDPKFAQENHYEIGDELTLYNNTFRIVGYGISPDYVNTLKNASDFLNSPKTFGIAYVTQEGFEKVNTDNAKSTLYSFTSDKENIAPLRDYLEDRTQLLDFRVKIDNSRIQAVFDDANGPKKMSIIIGILLVMIVAFIISISIKNNIKSESQTIGILYAQGFNKNELMHYYILLPALLVLIGSLMGYGGGMLVSRPLLLIEEAQYSLPYISLINSWYLVGIGLILPLALTLLITVFSLSTALNKTPLSLLSGDHSNSKVSRFEKAFTFKGLNFFARFRLKDMVRERGSMIALLFGVTLSMMILCTAAYTRDSCYKYVNDLKDNVPFIYMYTFIDQKDLNKYSKKGEQTVVKSVKADLKGGEKSFLVQGITPNSQFFEIPGIENLERGEVLISSSLLIKFNLRVGDSLILIDNVQNKEYPVMIKGTSNYDYGQYLYTNIRAFNQIFGIRKQSYNALMTHQPIGIADEKVSSTMNKNEMISGVQNLLTMVNVMAGIMLIGATLIFITVIYMLMKMIIDKSKINISMVKIFGYTPTEVSRMYLRGNFIILIIGFLLSLPAGYMITKILYDSIMMNMQQYILPYIKPSSILLAFIIMALSYRGACLLLAKTLERVLLTEALKNRE